MKRNIIAFSFQIICVYPKFVVPLQRFLECSNKKHNESETICQMGRRKNATH